MTPSGRGVEPGSDHAYFQAIEATFLRLRGSPLLLSPSDWQVARRWRRDGLPLAVVERALEELFAGRAERGVEGKVSSLRYCAPAVEAAGREWRRLTAPAVQGEPGGFDPRRRLAALAEAVPAGEQEWEELARQVRGLQGEPEEIEGRLAELDRRLVDSARARLGAAEAREIEVEIEAGLARLAERLPEEELERARERLLRREIRRRAGLPTLSLFAPEAAAADS